MGLLAPPSTQTTTLPMRTVLHQPVARLFDLIEAAQLVQSELPLFPDRLARVYPLRQLRSRSMAGIRANINQEMFSAVTMS